MLGAGADSAGSRNVLGNCLAQVRVALDRPVVGPALVERLLRGFNDVPGRLEIGLADFQVDDASPLCFQLAGCDQTRRMRSRRRSGPFVAASFIALPFRK